MTKNTKLTKSQQLALELENGCGHIVEVTQMDGRFACIIMKIAGWSSVPCRYGNIGPTGKVTWNS